MSDARPRLSDDERRRRLVVRHHLGATAPSAESATHDLVVLHASDPVAPWSVRPEGEVVTSLLRPIDRDSATAVATRAEALTAWLDGTHVSPRFPTPLERRLRTS